MKFKCEDIIEMYKSSKSVSYGEILDYNLPNSDNIKVFDYLFANGVDVCFDYQKFSADHFADYYGFARSIPSLNKEQEVFLIEKVKNGDKRALEKLLFHHLKLIFKVAFYYSGRGCELLELVQEGSIGFLNSVSKFDLDHVSDIRLSSFATKGISNCIRHYIRDNGSLVSVPAHFFVYLKKYNFAVNALRCELGRNPSDKEIADYTGFTIDTIYALRNFYGDYLSLEQKVFDDDNSCVKDIIPDSYDFVDEYEKKELLSNMYEAVSSLSIDEKKLIGYRYGFVGDKHSLQGAASVFGVTKATVRNRDLKIRKRLRDILIK